MFRLMLFICLLSAQSSFGTSSSESGERDVIPDRAVPQLSEEQEPEGQETVVIRAAPQWPEEPEGVVRKRAGAREDYTFTAPTVPDDYQGATAPQVLRKSFAAAEYLFLTEYEGLPPADARDRVSTEGDIPLPTPMIAHTMFGAMPESTQEIIFMKDLGNIFSDFIEAGLDMPAPLERVWHRKVLSLIRNNSIEQMEDISMVMSRMALGPRRRQAQMIPDILFSTFEHKIIEWVHQCGLLDGSFARRHKEGDASCQILSQCMDRIYGTLHGSGHPVVADFIEAYRSWSRFRRNLRGVMH